MEGRGVCERSGKNGVWFRTHIFVIISMYLTHQSRRKKETLPSVQNRQSSSDTGSEGSFALENPARSKHLRHHTHNPGSEGSFALVTLPDHKTSLNGWLGSKGSCALQPCLTITATHLQPQTPPHAPLVRITSSSRRRLSRPTVGVRNRTSEAESRVEQVSSTLVPRTGSLDLRLCILTCCLSRVIRVAHVGELITQRVGDDVGVQGLLLAATCERVSDLEGKFVGGPPILATFEGDGGCALAKVCACERGCAACCCTGGVVGILVCIACVLVVSYILILVLVLVGAVVTGILIRVVCIASILVRAPSGIVCVSSIARNTVSSTGILIHRTVAIGLLVVVVACCLLLAVAVTIVIRLILILVLVVGLLVVTTSVASCSCVRTRYLRNHKITESSLAHQIEHTQSISREWLCSRAGTEGCSIAIDVNSRVDERRNTSKLRGSRQTGVTADILDIVVGERVRVLLGCNEANGCSNGVRAAAEFADDLVGALELWGVSISWLMYC